MTLAEALGRAEGGARVGQDCWTLGGRMGGAGRGWWAGRGEGKSAHKKGGRGRELRRMPSS